MCAIARPMPLDAPVMSAAFSAVCQSSVATGSKWESNQLPWPSMRRPSALAVALLLLAVLGGCGSSSSDTTSSQSESPSSSTAKPEQFPAANGLSLDDLRQRY